MTTPGFPKVWDGNQYRENGTPAASPDSFVTLGAVQQLVNAAVAAGGGGQVDLTPYLPKTDAAVSYVPSSALLAVATSGALTKDKIQLINAKDAAVTTTALPALSSLAVGDTYGVEKTDGTTNPVVIPFAGGDTTMTGASQAQLFMPGTLLLRVTANPAGGRVWKVINHVRSDAALYDQFAAALGQYELQQLWGSGHSWLAIDSNATPGTRIPYRLASRLRMSGVTIKAVSGRTIGDISNLELSGTNVWTPRTKALVLDVCTINDITLFQGSAASRRGYNHAWRAKLSLRCSNAVIASNTAQFAYSANWTSETVTGTPASPQAATPNSTGGARFTTTTTGATVDYTYTDDGLGQDFVLVARAAGAGLAIATIGGVEVGRLDLTQPTAQDCTAILRVRGQAAGNKTVRITLASGSSLTIDSARVPSAAPPPMLVLGEPAVTPSPTDYANWSADLVTFKADLAAIVTEFPTAAYVELDTPQFDNATMLVTDSNNGRKHPNDKGCAYIAAQCVKAAIRLGYLLGLNITTSATGYPAAYVAPAAPAIPSGGQDGTGASSGGSTAPGAPTAVTATAGAGQATVAWTAPASNGGSAITDYVIQYRTTAGPGAWTTFADGTSTATSATVTGLTNGTGYDFQVAAVNAIGQGSYSSSASATPSAGAATVTSGYTHRHVASSDAAAAGAVTQSWANGGTSTTPFTASSATTGPTKRIVSSKHYFEFDGVDDQMTRGAGVARPLTVAMVVRFRTTGSSGALNRGTADQIGKSSGNSPYVSNGTLLSSGATDDQKFHIMTFVNNGDGTGSVQIDGGAPVTGSIGSNAAIATSSTFMGRSTSGTAFFQIDVAEEIEWPSALTSGQIANTVTALQSTYSGLLGT